jgi:hypothetical protein
MALDRRWWLILPAAGILTLFFVPIHPTVHEGIWKAVGDALHYPLIASVTLLVFLVSRAGGRSAAVRYRVTGLFAVVIVALIELIQPLFGRSASWNDALIGILGVISALGGIYAWREGGFAFRAGHTILATLVMGTLLLPTWMEWRAAGWRTASFPLLGGFEEAIELRLWRDHSPKKKWPTTLKISSEHVSEGRHSLAVRIGDGAWPGVVYYAGGSDWSAYDHLRWDVYNPSKPFRLAIRVDDRFDLRYEKSFHTSMRVEPGWNRFEIPVSRIRDEPKLGALDLTRIRRLYVYADGDGSGLFFIDHVRLTAS